MGAKEIIEKVPLYNAIVLPYHMGQAMAAGARYGFPGKKLRVIG